MKFGVAYYPEQWPEEQWAADAQMMVEMGIDVVRIGEFAWWKLEPRRERIDTTWLEKAVDVLAGRGLEIVMGTPTAAPPAWLFNRHPNILPLRADGRRWYLGSRAHACINNPAYNKYARRIVIELARTFRDDAIWGWQVDNELGLGPTGMCYCEECEKAFRRWLKRRYGRIDRLNRIWGTSVWSQGYNDWHEIPAPRRTVCGPHPSLSLDYNRFMSAQYRNFVEEQREIITDYVGEDEVITVNEPSGSELHHIDMFSLSNQQEVVSLDNYPADTTRLDQTCFGLDFARSLKGKKFWIMEQQAGAALVSGHTQQPRPGQLRLWTYQAAVRGAELISYFRWRTAKTGQEMHWYGLFDADGSPRRRLDEIKKTVREMRDEASLFDDYEPVVHAAIVVDYESAWAFNATPFGWDGDYWETVEEVYGAFRRQGIVVDFIEKDDNFSPYDLIVAPMQFVTTPAMAKRMKVFAHDGGTLVVSAPAGYKTPKGTTVDAPVPGPFTEVLGVEIAECDVLGDHIENSWSPVKNPELEFEADGLCSVVELRGAESIGEYNHEFYEGTPAVCAVKEGRGKVFFSGVALDREGWEWLLDKATYVAKITSHRWADDNVEVVKLRSKDDGTSHICVLNHGAETVELSLKENEMARDVLDGKEYQAVVEVPGHDLVMLHM